MDTQGLKKIAVSFQNEIQNSLKRKGASLSFIIHELSPTLLVKEGENFEVLVVGGSVLKKALIRKTKKGIKILKIESERNIHFGNGKDFLNLVGRELYPEIKTLALNFAYPLQPVFENGKLDGIFLGPTKGVNLHNLTGKKIGKEIEDNVFNKLKRTIRVSVANDAVCLILSGLTKFRWNNLSAGIVGTGLNFAFFLGKNKLVNLESASFDKFTQSPQGEIVDRASDKPGKSLFEKEVAGAYLYKHFNILIKEKNINHPSISSTEELNIISHKNIPKVSEIAQNILKRSAQLVACQIAGIVVFKKRDMVFNMEGSLFWKGNNYKETVKDTALKLVPKYNVTFTEIKNSAILGAAKLVS